MKVKLRELSAALSNLQHYRDGNDVEIELEVIEEDLQNDQLCSIVRVTRRSEEEATNYSNNTKYIKKISKTIEIYPGENRKPTISETSVSELD